MRHLQIRKPNGEWVPYCCGLSAFINHPLGLPSVMDVHCMNPDDDSKMDEMVFICIEHELPVRLNEGPCPISMEE
jgi:hypothetical protein